MMQGENLQMELEIIVITFLEADVPPILIGRDQIGIDLKNLLELTFLRLLCHGSTVELG